METTPAGGHLRAMMFLAVHSSMNSSVEGKKFKRGWSSIDAALSAFAAWPGAPKGGWPAYRWEVARKCGEGNIPLVCEEGNIALGEGRLFQVADSKLSIREVQYGPRFCGYVITSSAARLTLKYRQGSSTT
jgi:hypothetical protein